MAKLLKVSIHTIVNWENNRSTPQKHFYPLIIDFIGFYPLEINDNKLSTQIKNYRSIHGFSYKKLGELINVDASTIRSWEKEYNKPQIAMKKRLMAELKMEKTYSAAA